MNGRNYFTGELEAAVAKKFDRDEAADAVRRALEFGYLNDERLFRDFVRWKTEDGHGEYYIKDKLRLKGIVRSAAEIRTVMEEEGFDAVSGIKLLIAKYKKTQMLPAFSGGM